MMSLAESPGPMLHTRLVKMSQGVSSRRVGRFFSQPIRSVWPIVMRQAGFQRTVDVPTFWGGTFTGVLPEGVTTYIWRFGFFDADVCLTLIRFLRPGSTFLDIGAHFGFFSLLGSYLVGPKGKCIAIEAIPSTFEILSNNIGRNALYPNVSLHQVAAFNRDTTLDFADFGVVASSLNSSFGPRGDKALISGKRKVKVRAKATDTILTEMQAPKVDVVKIDAESAEKFVIAGLSQRLRSDRPVVVMEAGDITAEGASPTSELIALMAQYDYRPFAWSPEGELLPFDEHASTRYANLVFSPS